MSVLLAWLLPSAVGFVLGYAVCLAARVTVEAEHSPDPAQRTRGERLRVMLGVLLIAMGAIGYYQVYDTNDCFRENLQLRSASQGAQIGAALESIRAQRDLLTTPNPDRDPAISRAAVARYLAALDAQERSLLDTERARREHPLEC